MGFVAVPEAPDPSIFDPKNQKVESSTASQSSIIGEISDSDFDLDPKRARRVYKEAEKSLAGQLPPNKAVEKLPQLKLEDVQTGPILALGGFGLVKEVKKIPKLAAASSDDDNNNKLVLKTLIPHKKTDQIVSGANHIYRERHFLSLLNHPHIIQLRAVSAGSLRTIQETKRLDSCFLILDYLPDTLNFRISRWRKERREETRKQMPWSFKKLDRLNANKELLAEQLKIAMDVASALEYLHSKRIIYRDLKPANVGFNQAGELKLFDFGLATQLKQDSDLDSTHDHLSGKVGTTRYMASEVLRKEPYNVKADVFSFSLLLWELLTLEKPHDKMPEAAVYGDRPKLPKHWPDALKRILERGWSEDLSERPHVMEFKFVLKDLLRQAE